MVETYKSPEQIAFESRVLDAVARIALYPPEHLDVIDRIATDLFSGGDPDGYSQNDDLYWRDLPDVPPFTRGRTTYPAKLQWRIKASRIMDILDQWMREQARRAKLEVVN